MKAVPGGSVLKMLGGLKELGQDVDWSKVYLFYVNHKCVPSDDASATHFKAKSIFLDACPVIAHSMAATAPGMTKGHDTDAHMYRAQMEAVMPQYDGLPIFDYMLLGMGKDGHIGSLYPGRKEVLMTDKHQWVLSVDKKVPSSITLSLPVMNAARYYIRNIFTRVPLDIAVRPLQFSHRVSRVSTELIIVNKFITGRINSCSLHSMFTIFREVRVVLSGADKAEAVLSGVTRNKAAYDFPVCGVTNALWMVDGPAAQLLQQSNANKSPADQITCASK